MGNSRRTINIDCKAKSLWTEDNALWDLWWDQKDLIYYELLKLDETVNTERYRQQMRNLNQALYEKRISKKATQSDFAS